MRTNGEFDREIDARRNNTALRTVASSTTTTRLRWWLHPAFTAGGAASLVGAARPLVA